MEKLDRQSEGRSDAAPEGQRDYLEEYKVLKAENEKLWQAIERHAPQVIEMLAEQGDVALLAEVAKRLSNRSSPVSSSMPSSDTDSSASAPDLGPYQDFIDEVAKKIVDTLFPSSPVEAVFEQVASAQREAGRLEEYNRQQAVRLGSVERGSSERLEPSVSLDPKGREIARALGISEEKLAQAAAERLRKKGVIRP